MDNDHGILTIIFSKNKEWHRNVHGTMLNFRKEGENGCKYMLGTQDHEIDIWIYSGRFWWIYQ